MGYADVTGTAGPGLSLLGSTTALLSGGTFDGAPDAIESMDMPVIDLPAEGYGYFDEADAPVTPEKGQRDLDGPVTVHELAAPAQPTATPAPTATPTPTGVPDTGDNTALLGWVLLLGGCAAALAAVLLLRRALAHIRTR